MVVRTVARIALLVALPLQAAAFAQNAHVRAWVENPIQEIERPFWIFVEASGQTVATPVIPDVEGLIINRARPRQSQSFSVVIVQGRSEHQQSIKLAYQATAIRPGPITIPPFEILVNGGTVRTEPVEITVQGTATQTPAGRAQLRAWIEEETIIVGKPFWFYIEATGGKITMAENIEVDGLSIDTKNVHRSSTSAFGVSSTQTTLKNGYHSTALRAGDIVIPAFDVVVDNQLLRTSPLSIKVLEHAPDPGTINVAGGTVVNSEPSKNDYLFIRMETDKNEVFQGEPILMTTQLWRIIYRRIESGPYRGQLNVTPSTEGFYVTFLEPRNFKARNGPWQYDVSEERKLLYPTALGSLRIGQWHWEGVALINRQNVISRERKHYKLNAGPIHIKVKPLPPRPKNFSGAVGQFDVQAALSSDTVTQGVPITLSATVTGRGNPDAVGPPVLREIGWARIGDPEQKTDTFISPDTNLPTVSRTFSFDLVPLNEGDFELPEVEFVYFDPEKESYQTKTAGPFKVSVLPSSEVQRRIIVADDIELERKGVNILIEDIRPIAAFSGSLEPRRTPFFMYPSAILLPLVLYLSLFAFMSRKRRFARDTGFARAYYAKSKALGTIGGATQAGKPTEDLHRALTDYLADIFNLDHAAMTSAEVEELLGREGLSSGTRENMVKILRACERVNYASQDLSFDEFQALARGAEACISDLDALKQRARRS